MGTKLPCLQPALSLPPSLPSLGLTQELNSEVAGFREQSPSDDNLLSRVESIPHDQGDAWVGTKNGPA